ncbi:hypothetical protein [Microbacterium sp. 5K110]|uniref:hypothetical protein n=1 Tax=unclassified Microbacterium TaxID=2609290 RepID=UPI0010FE5817|nr:hypothetical protein [Microbacterium sp. 5K110]TLF26801.1 hypothetical protein FE256_16455 [Microbacterium sp. 5K110]
MSPIWEESSRKHGVSQSDQVYAILHATYVATLPETGQRGGRVVLYIGPEHAQTSRELEVLVEDFGGVPEARVFHAMRLGPKLRRYREENPG